MFIYTSLNILFLFFFFNDTATTEIYTLSLHDALPISLRFLLGPPASSGPAAPTDSRSSQLRLGAESRRGGARGCQSSSAAESLRPRRCGSLRQGRPHPCLGHLERAQC